MSRSDRLGNETMHLKRLKKNRENLNFEKDKWLKQKNDNGPPKKDDIKENDLLRYNCIKSLIEREITFNNQLSALLNAVQLTESEWITRYSIICPHLDEIFRSIFPQCRSFTFGSTMAQLGFKTSDLDIYMYVGEKDGISIDLPLDEWTLMIFKKVRKVMYRMKFVFANIIPIPKAKTPIIKFRYLPTNVSCDITFKNSIGIYKSNFIRYCASRDPRIRPLMMLIKYWAKHFEILGMGKFCSHELMCMIVFYLQQESVGLLPTMLTLQRTCPPQLVCGWQVNFNEATPLPAITNNSDIAALFHNFFNFYAKFDFNTYMISLLDGKVYVRDDMSEIDLIDLPDYMHRYVNGVMNGDIWRVKLWCPATIQDPIELNQNLAANTNKRALEAFQNCCECSANICSMVKEKNYDNLLILLFGRTISGYQ